MRTAQPNLTFCFYGEAMCRPNTSLREMAVVVQVHAGSWAKCRAVPEDKAQAKRPPRGCNHGRAEHFGG